MTLPISRVFWPAALFAVAVLLFASLTIQFSVPLCWNTLAIRTPQEALAAALIEASRHPKVQLGLEDPVKRAKFLAENPNCCHPLDRSHPFYAKGLLDGIWGAQTVIWEIATPSVTSGKTYTSFVWIDRCGTAVETAGTEF